MLGARMGYHLGMTVDVSAVVVIRRPRDEVAACAVNPDNASEWYVNSASVQWRSEPPVRAGSHIAFLAQFLGRRLASTYEVVEFAPGERLVVCAARDRSRWRPSTCGSPRQGATRA